MKTYEFQDSVALGTALFENDIDEIIRLAKKFADVERWQPISTYCDVMTVADFVEEVNAGSIIDYDGHGYFANLEEGLQCVNCPVELSLVCRDDLPTLRYKITHIAWFNK